jgi:hypothetical protein
MAQLITRAEILNPVYLGKLIEFSQKNNAPDLLALAENIRSLEGALAICSLLIGGGALGFCSSPLGSPKSLLSMGVMAFAGLRVMPIVTVLVSDADRLLNVANEAILSAEKDKKASTTLKGKFMSMLYLSKKV